LSNFRPLVELLHMYIHFLNACAIGHNLPLSAVGSAPDPQAVFETTTAKW
jgi:hypothetical protein